MHNAAPSRPLFGSNGPLDTSRLILDALRPDDAAALFAYRSDPAVARHQGWQPVNQDEAADFITAQASVEFPSAGQWCQRAIRLRDSGALIGDLGLRFPDASDDAVELGISLAPAHQGNGYAREALTQVLDLVFGPLAYRRVVASIDPRNLRCMALLRALGLRQEVHHRQSLFWHGEWVDDLIFALLASEWPRAGSV